jgi:dTDP-4-amino-4,6-dideoxy-D-galactose acyltransferase
MNNTSWNPLAFIHRFWDDQAQVHEPAPALSCRKLDWDSAYFDADIHRLDFLPDGISSADFSASLPQKNPGRKTYVFTEVPTEAVSAFRLLSDHGFTLVETRLTYFHLLNNLPPINRNCRPAKQQDLPFLKKTASEAVNPFDRYHSDPFFSEKQASAYLETYIENCLNGFSELVFVPELETSPASFAAVSRVNIAGESIYRIPLTAALAENKGWHYHLCLAALHHAKNKNAPALVMTTQSGNKAVIHNCEKLGFKLGSIFHIFSREL